MLLLQGGLVLAEQMGTLEAYSLKLERQVADLREENGLLQHAVEALHQVMQQQPLNSPLQGGPAGQRSSRDGMGQGRLSWGGRLACLACRAARRGQTPRSKQCRRSGLRAARQAVRDYKQPCYCLTTIWGESIL